MLGRAGWFALQIMRTISPSQRPTTSSGGRGAGVRLRSITTVEYFVTQKNVSVGRKNQIFLIDIKS